MRLSPLATSPKYPFCNSFPHRKLQLHSGVGSDYINCKLTLTKKTIIETTMVIKLYTHKINWGLLEKKMIINGLFSFFLLTFGRLSTYISYTI